jgi:hypothetical protein
MTSPDPGHRGKPRDDRNAPETTGGADAVDKTTYTAPSGSDQADVAGTDPVATARVRSGAFGPLAWAALLLTLLVLVIYGLGFLR